ncbi:MAG TPA: FtsX-like permease family protein [Ktedonobacteraceae bacterium]|nr:FtsX-like permease family protein [Ktedonobacteraceae bacterium]
MTQLFGMPLDTLTIILVAITISIIVGVGLLAVTNAIFFKIGIRNIPRRRSQMLLIVCALMLSTILLSSVLATGDVITAAVQTVAVSNLGNVDETIQSSSSPGFFDDWVYFRLRNRVRNDPNIAAVGAALIEQGVLVADVSSRQVRSKVTALGVIPGSEQGFGAIQDDTNKVQYHIADLQINQVYLNHTLAVLLNAHAGDTIYLYSKRWPGKRYTMHVQAIIADGGLVGELPYIVSQAKTFRDIEHRFDDITQIFVHIRGTDAIGFDVSEAVKQTLSRRIPSYLHVNEVKEQGVQFAQLADDIFSRIFSLFALFALAIGLLLIFLIFVLLAAERRAEMGMARAIGVQRRHLVLMYVFEGTVYDLISSCIGLFIGLGIGALLFLFLEPILARFNFPLKLVIQPRSLIIAFCLGVIFTFFSVGLSAWVVSRMTVVDALRNLPESERPSASLTEIVTTFLVLVKRMRSTHTIRRILVEQIPDTVIALISRLAQLGILPLLAGYLLLEFGLKRFQITPFSLGLSLLVIGIGLLLVSCIDWISDRLGKNNWKKPVQRIFATVVGLTIFAYWALPFDALAVLGLPRFQGGVEVFFVASIMMVFGVVWAFVANADLLIRPLLALCSWLPGLQIMTRLASAYPLHHRFRTGLSIIMFSLVVFAMTTMAVITNAMQNNYTDINYQTGGYDIQAVAYFKPISDIRSVLASHGIDPNAFSAIGTQASTAVGVIQPNADTPAWHIYPAQVVSGGFLQGYGLHLTARAKGFNDDNAVWQALQSHPNYALIDNTALPYRPFSLVNSPVYDPNAPSPASAGTPSIPPGFDPYYTYSMDGVYQGDASFAPTPVWVTGFQQSSAIKLTIIGIVDNSDSAHFGLYISQKAYSNFQTDPSTPDTETYYFKVAPGQDKRALALELGSAFLDNGLETTVLEDAIWTVRGPRILLSNVLLGVVGLTLLLGVAALAITGTRAVVERRQQIGMLRALGSKRRMLQGAFLCESFFVGCVGSLIGVTLGLILSRNIFAVNFFEQFHTGLTFSVPWEELGLIVGIALLASLIAALLPAWQAGRVAPSESLRS